jgi:hypothetical protein
VRPAGPAMSQAVARAGSAGVLVGWADPLRLSMPGRGPRGVWLGDNGHDSCPEAPMRATETAEYPILSSYRADTRGRTRRALIGIGATVPTRAGGGWCAGRRQAATHHRGEPGATHPGGPGLALPEGGPKMILMGHAWAGELALT